VTRGSSWPAHRCTRTRRPRSLRPARTALSSSWRPHGLVADAHNGRAGAPRALAALGHGRCGMGVGARRGQGHPKLWGEAPVTSLTSVGYKFLRL
jgi:hypothetical protein